MNRRDFIVALAPSLVIPGLLFAEVDQTNVSMAMYLELLKSNRPKPSDLKQDLKTPKTIKPIVRVYFPDFSCPHCLRLIEETKDWDDAPFVFTYPKTGPGFKIEAWPYLHWRDSNGVWRDYKGWSSREKFLEKWESYNAIDPKAIKPLAKPQTNNYTPTINPPNGVSLSWHLQNEHHVSIANLSTDEMEMLHDRLHNWGRKLRKKGR